ncbi:MAG: hypothetical protein A2452_00420 [Candidatus Firestonebacteria bacterium RIFOXYC2_FULL_39_67]|nr:MAG: hypothetical protein A2536_03505 [Candidatus Firestonebacteria bacterium RIFOXYD2_FULL_39_29]OGF54897.1 MAG: hypothetical protein A2452_00420 [Candidatus Firestonebacteria bacterium RIFOXYC2_FULL_39_67]
MKKIFKIMLGARTLIVALFSAIIGYIFITKIYDNYFISTTILIVIITLIAILGLRRSWTEKDLSDEEKLKLSEKRSINIGKHYGNYILIFVAFSFVFFIIVMISIFVFK